MKADTKTAKRRRAQQWGRLAEWIAAASLIFKGYRILKMRYKTKTGEVDIIARKGRLIVMAEVKARATIEEALDAVTGTAQHRIESAGDLWLARQKNAHLLSIRFDIIAVRPWRWPSHYENAF